MLGVEWVQICQRDDSIRHENPTRYMKGDNKKNTTEVKVVINILYLYAASFAPLSNFDMDSYGLEQKRYFKIFQ